MKGKFFTEVRAKRLARVLLGVALIIGIFAMIYSMFLPTGIFGFAVCFGFGILSYIAWQLLRRNKQCENFISEQEIGQKSRMLIEQMSTGKISSQSAEKLLKEIAAQTLKNNQR